MHPTPPAPHLPPELDGCAICGGHRGGVPGNGNIIEGLLVCDHCHARMPARPEGVVSAKTVATYCFGLEEQLLLLTQALYAASADVGSPLDIITRMQKLLFEVRQLPPASQ